MMVLFRWNATVVLSKTYEHKPVNGAHAASRGKDPLPALPSISQSRPRQPASPGHNLGPRSSLPSGGNRVPIYVFSVHAWMQRQPAISLGAVKLLGDTGLTPLPPDPKGNRPLAGVLPNATVCV
eukprot:scaffold287206_cov37-Tisochrysis_lutea.AAC.1